MAPGYLAQLREQGFTRISLGMQSAVPRVLEVLDRTHRPGRPEQAVAEARAAGFEHVNLDLIYGAPGESDADWRASLEAAIAAEPDHVSAYALVVEEGTALARQVAAGIVEAVDDDVLADRYVMAEETLLRGRLRLVRGVELGPRRRRPLPAQRALLARRQLVGLRARRPQPRRRRALVERQAPGPLRGRAERGPSPAAGARDGSTTSGAATERVMLGVRLRDGLPCATLPEAPATVPQLARWGLVESASCREGRIVLTLRGRLMADAVVRELTADERRAECVAQRPAGGCVLRIAATASRSSTRTWMAVRVLERGPQGPVHAVLQVELAVPGHRVREKVAVEGRILGQQLVQTQFALGRDQLGEPDRARGDRGPVTSGQPVLGVRASVGDGLEDHLISSGRDAVCGSPSTGAGRSDERFTRSRREIVTYVC